jgi:hypothetical protein
LRLFRCNLLLLVAVEGSQGLNEVAVRIPAASVVSNKSKSVGSDNYSLVVAGLGGRFRHFDIQPPLLVLICAPHIEPAFQIL